MAILDSIGISRIAFKCPGNPIFLCVPYCLTIILGISMAILDSIGGRLHGRYLLLDAECNFIDLGNISI